MEDVLDMAKSSGGGGFGSPADLIDGIVTGTVANIVLGLVLGFALPTLTRALATRGRF